ncbi:growth factor receptor domain-containing protein [Exidia glandulosa HHB12029]|uniref:Growth factor receptor domain-containing protein n=1 Tax=Exidia glandulosa HHB12029 TaxID=1314781 RepID=A0A165FIE6_EXIGL|nr:growth factor receptor domain-containing protein [Exidia glandulosa HHB12029]
MLASVLPLVLLAAATVAAPQSTTTTLCVAGQCLSGSSNISIGAVVSAFGTDPLILLPGTYSSTSDPQSLRSALTSTSSRLNFLPGFAPNNSDSSSSSISFPLDIHLQPGVLSTTASLYRGQTAFTPANGALNATAVPAGSLVVASNVWAAVKSGDQRTVIWDSVPDMAQLPGGVGSSMTLVDLQSTACSPACSGAGICTPQGTCVCPSGGGFEGDKCESCADGFFGPSCTKCPDDCDKCDDGMTGSGKCLVPKVANAPSSCNCLNGQCGANGQCECNPGWTNASNGTACAACAQGFFLTPDGNCQACQLGCQSCQNGNGVCTSCSSGLTVDANDNTKCTVSANAGAKQCPDGSFLNGDSCAVCSPLCKTCTGAGSGACLVCAQGTYKLAGACVPVDSNGVCSGSALVANNNKNLCDACPSRCASCGIPGFNVASTIDQVQCSKCLPGSYLTDGKCVDACPAGTLVSPDDGFTCVACDSSCSTCAGDAKFCLTCSGNGLANNGTCTNSCPSGTFSASGACLPCHADCASCSGGGFNQCTSCKADRPVLQGGSNSSSGGRCLPTCSKAQFFDTTSSSCQACDASCSSCSGSGANRCLACANSGQTLKGGACVDAKCDSGSSVVPGLGVCLSELVAAPFVDNTPTPSGDSPVPPPTSGGGRRPLEWWQILLMALGCAFICLLFVMCYRRRMRKKRAARTAAFARQMKSRGLLSRGAHWLGDKLFGRLHHHHRDAVPAHYNHQEDPEKNMGEMLERMRAAEEARHAREMELLEARARSATPSKWDRAPSFTVRLEDARSYSPHPHSRTASPQPSLRPRYEPGALEVDPYPNRASTPSLYSTMTGLPRRTPEPRMPIRDRHGDMDLIELHQPVPTVPLAATSRFSGSSWGSSIWKQGHQPVPVQQQPSYEMDPVRAHRTGESFESYQSNSSSGSQSRNPFRR